VAGAAFEPGAVLFCRVECLQHIIIDGQCKGLLVLSLTDGWCGLQERKLVQDSLYVLDPHHTSFVSQDEQEFAGILPIVDIDSSDLRELHDARSIDPVHDALVVTTGHPDEQVALHVARQQQRERLQELYHGDVGVMGVFEMVHLPERIIIKKLDGVVLRSGRYQSQVVVVVSARDIPLVAVFLLFQHLCCGSATAGRPLALGLCNLLKAMYFEASIPSRCNNLLVLGIITDKRDLAL